MPVYKIFGVFSASGPQIEVEADSLKEAIDVAIDDGELVETLCHQCAGLVDLSDEPNFLVVTHPNGEEEQVQL